MFSSPIGESIFSTMTQKYLTKWVTYVLVPYRGIYFLYATENLVNAKALKRFSSPIGESIFSTINRNNLFARSLQSSRPLSGNLFSLQEQGYCYNDVRGRSRPLSGNLFSLRCIHPAGMGYHDWFSSPIGESIFSTNGKLRLMIRGCEVLVPYRGIYFLYLLTANGLVKNFCVLVPYRGIYFLYEKEDIMRINLKMVLVPYRGIYFLYLLSPGMGQVTHGSRPLSGNLFSLLMSRNVKKCVICVLVPYRGIYFLYKMRTS